jgi:hypothetical protein
VTGTDLTSIEMELAEAEREVAVARQRLAATDAWLAEHAAIQAEREALMHDMNALREHGERCIREGMATPTAADTQQFCAIRDHHFRLQERSDAHSAVLLRTVEPWGSA